MLVHALVAILTCAKLVVLARRPLHRRDSPTTAECLGQIPYFYYNLEHLWVIVIFLAYIIRCCRTCSALDFLSECAAWSTDDFYHILYKSLRAIFTRPLSRADRSTIRLDLRIWPLLRLPNDLKGCFHLSLSLFRNCKLCFLC